MEKQISLFEQVPQTAASAKTGPSKPAPAKKNNAWKIFIDGASRGNPGPSGTGMHFEKDQDEKVIRKGFFIGNKTNNQAEYYALIVALYYIKEELASQSEKPTITVISDSELLINQMKGVYRVRNEKLLPLYGVIMRLRENLTITFKHVLREKNIDADALANEGIDKKKKLPVAIAKLLNSE